MSTPIIEGLRYIRKSVYSKNHIRVGCRVKTGKIRVLFVCTANAARSQLAKALLRHTEPVHFEAFSAVTSDQ
ncbi:hypothetical protein [Pseudomonas putida]|uniref:arsenate reductase/protein-tyrosine-phosphatase family protein n=1 Tax=Pseudomonas putida TaxID=303 RepID=UPI003F68B611